MSLGVIVELQECLAKLRRIWRLNPDDSHDSDVEFWNGYRCALRDLEEMMEDGE